jgi:predicted small integral membrane protein
MISMLSLAALTLFPALWMATGALDNIRHPDLNRQVVSRVMRLELMEQQYPDDFARISHRRIKSDGLIRFLFGIIVLAELTAALLLLAGAIGLGLAAIGAADLATMRDIALAGAVVFTGVWAGFLAGGNYFCYYFCHFEGQFTHFCLAIWGAITCGILILAV